MLAPPLSVGVVAMLAPAKPHHAPTPRPAHRVLLATLATPLFGNLSNTTATTRPPMNVLCQVPAFCAAYKRIANGTAAVKLDLGVLSATSWDLSRECPEAQLLVPDRELLAATDALYSGRGRNCNCCAPVNSRINSIKWWLVSLTDYDFVVYADLDIDMERVITDQVRAAVMFLAEQTAAISAGDDWASPVNTGIMVFRPSTSRYTELLAMRKTGVFDGSPNNGTGFNRSGTPRSFMSTAQLQKWAWTRMVRHNSWNTIAGDSDQGMFTWYGLQDGVVFGRKIRVGHFWWQWKPYFCDRWVRMSNLTLQPHSTCRSTMAYWFNNSNGVCRRNKQYI
eukprot:7039318-Prymnesium_polylepis.1